NVERTSNWALRPRTRVYAKPLTNEERDRCRVTVARIDVTHQALGAAQAALQKELNEFDRRVTRFDLRAEAQKVWDVLRSPLRLTDSLWLVINPTSVRIGLLKVQADTLVPTRRLSPRPRTP